MLLYETTASCSSALSASPHQTSSAQLDVSLYLLLLLSFGVYSGCFQEPQEAELISASAAGQLVLAAWAPHLAVLNLQLSHLRSADGSDAPAAPAAAAAGNVYALCDKKQLEQQQLDQQQLEQQQSRCGCWERRLCGCSSAAECACCGVCAWADAGWAATTAIPDAIHVLAAGRRITSCGNGGGSNSTPERCSGGCCTAEPICTPAGERRAALAALVASARAHLAKDPLLVCHLARRTGLLHLLFKEALAAAGGKAGAGAEQLSQLTAAAEVPAPRQQRLLEV